MIPLLSATQSLSSGPGFDVSPPSAESALCLKCLGNYHVYDACTCAASQPKACDHSPKECLAGGGFCWKQR